MRRNITQTIITAVISLIATTAWAQAPTLTGLTIVETKEVKIERELHSNIATTVELNVAEAIARLNAMPTAENIYTTVYDVDNDAVKDELTNTTNNSDEEAWGWWYTEVYDSESGETNGLNAAAPYDPTTTTIHVRDYSLYDGVLNLFVGHNPRVVEAGKTYSASLYIVSGTDAVEMKLNVTITGSSDDDMKLAGYEVTNLTTADIAINYNGSYRYKTIDIPADSILALIPQPDCCFTYQWNEGLAELSLYALASEGQLTDNATANRGGFWLNSDGYVCTWGDEGCSFFVEPDDSLGLNLLHVGLYPNYSMIGETLHTTLYLAGDGLYAININLEVLPQVTMNDCEVVSTLDYTVEILTSNTGTGTYVQSDDMKDAIDLTALIEETLGLDETSFVALSYFPGQGYQNMVSAYQISVNSDIADAPNMGYQMMDLDYFIQQTGDDSYAHIAAPFNPLPILTPAYAIGYDNGKLSFWQKDGTRQTGDYYTARFVIYNTDAAKRFDLNITVVFVDKLGPKPDVIATKDIVLPTANDDGNDYAATAFDFTGIASALGAESADDIKWLAYNQLGQLLDTPYDDIYGFTFDADGHLTDAEADNAAFSVGYADGEFHTFVQPDAADTDYTATLIAYFGDKAYKFNITLTDTPVQREDINGDGKVDTQDVLSIYEHMRTTTGDATHFDVNGDGQVDTQDVLKVYESMQNL